MLLFRCQSAHIQLHPDNVPTGLGTTAPRHCFPTGISPSDRAGALRTTQSWAGV